MTPRERKLREVLNVRLEEALARELARIAGSKGQSESEVARSLLRYGIEVQRQLESQSLAIPWAWDRPSDEEPWPGVVEITAKWRPMTDDEIDEHGLRSYMGDPMFETGEEE